MQKEGSSRIKTMMKRRPRNNTDSEAVSGYDVMEKDGPLPAPVRRRLHSLFGSIEREFEKLYVENVSLHEKVEYLTEKLTSESSIADKDTLDGMPDNVHSMKAKKSSHFGQKIKSTYKVSTSRLASTFKQTSSSSISSLVKEFRGHRDGVWEVNVSRSGQKVIGTASADNTARLWSIETGLCVLKYLGHSGSVNSIRFHPTQDLVLTASGDQTAHIWKKPTDIDVTAKLSSEDEVEGSEKEDSADVHDAQDLLDSSLVRTPLTELDGHSNVIIAADWLASGSHVITGSWDRSAHVYDIETREILTVLTGHELELTNVSCHPSQQLVITSSKDATFRLADLRNPSMKLNVFQGHTQPVTTAIFAGGDKIVSGGDDRTVKIWDLKNMLSPIATMRTDSAVNRLAVSSTTNTLAVPQDNRHIRLYDFNGVRLGRLPRSNRQGHRRMVCAMAWDDDNFMCNLFSCGFDRQVLGWNVNLHAKE